MVTKATSPKIAKVASRVISSNAIGHSSKRAAANTLSQVNPTKTTSKTIAREASTVLREGRTSTAAKSVAGSALSQASAKGISQRTIKPAAKTGIISRAIAHKAVSAVMSSKKK